MLHSRRRFQPLRWLGVLAAFAASCSVAASAIASEYGAQRVVAIGDIHGEYDGLLSILQASGLVDAEGRWSGGRTTLVQTGDLTDRGAHVRQVLDLLMSLEQQAAEEGGRVIVLMGNHEMTNLLGDFQDVTDDIFASFATDESEKLRERAWKEWVRWMRQLARSRGGSPPELGKEVKARWMTEHPPGFFEYQQAMRADGRYGRWLSERPVMVRIGDIAYMHAGVSPEYADQSIEAINELHRREIETFNENRAEMVKKGVIPSFFNLYEINQALVFQSTNPPVEQYQDPARDRLVAKAAEDLNRLQAILLENSPLWYRGYTTLPDEELRQHLSRLEQILGAHRFVVAHSPMATGEIRTRLDGRVFLIDTGMLASYYAGRPSALEVADGHISALYLDHRQVLVDTAEVTVPATATSDSPIARRLSERGVPALLRARTGSRVRPAAYPPAAADGAALPERLWLDPNGNRLPFQTPEEVEEFLSTAQVVSMENIPKGVTKPKKILLEAGGVRAHAKFNYVDRQGQREKLADGTMEMYFLDSFRADLAAYELSRLLGMDGVPPASATSTGRTASCSCGSRA